MTDDMKNVAPETATKKVRPPQKRGRKTTKVDTAFKAITHTQISVTEFCELHKVSISVLRQHKRFDKFPELGEVKVLKDKETGELMIWREQPKNGSD